MNAPATKQPLEILPARQRNSFSLVPRDLGQAMELAKIISDSDLAPKDYKGKPGNVMIAVQMGREVGLSPMSAIQSIAIINGKPCLYGDVGKAILLSNGMIIEEDDVETIKKTGAGRCRITRPGHPPCERTFSIASAKTAGLWGKQGPWTNYPERQMAWRAFWFAARDVAADWLKGLGGAEEIRDVMERDITPMKPPVDPGPQPYPAEAFSKNLPTWTNLIVTGKKTAEQIIATVSSKAVLSDEQKQQIKAVKKSQTIDHQTGEISDGPPAVNYEALLARLQTGTSVDALDEDATLIGQVDGQDRQNVLAKAYQTRRAELVQEKA